MTAENEGTGAPEGDDPFAYLYRQEGGGSEGGAAAAPQPGVPRRSYNQVRAVGERSYGGRQGVQTAAYPGYEQPGGSSPSAHYAAPETVPGGRAAVRQQAGGHGQGRGGRGAARGGGNRNGLLIVAVAVVAAVVIGIGTAMLFNGEDGTGTGNPQAGTTPTAGPGGGGDQGGGQNEGGDKGDGEEKADLPKEDAAALRLGGKAQAASSIPGAKARNGAYVGMNAVGSSATWDTEVQKSGTYNLYVSYSVPGQDMKMSLDVNGKPHATGLNMKNFAKAPKGDWEKGWTYTYATVQLEKGQNSFVISCKQGDRCNVLLDQVWLAPPGEE